MNNIAISDIIKQFNISLSNIEAALTLVEYAVDNDMPISKLAKLTIQESCEELQNATERLSSIIGD